jgi:hypothetical protein
MMKAIFHWLLSTLPKAIVDEPSFEEEVVPRAVIESSDESDEEIPKAVVEPSEDDLTPSEDDEAGTTLSQ